MGDGRGRRSSARPPVQSVATTAALRFAGPVSATGVRLAFDRRPPALSVRSALGGATVAVLGMTAVLTFSASLDRLGSSPGRWGYPWDLTPNFTSAEVDRAADKLNGDDTLAGVARWDSGFSYINGEGVRAFGLRRCAARWASRSARVINRPGRLDCDRSGHSPKAGGDGWRQGRRRGGVGWQSRHRSRGRYRPVSRDR